MKVYLRKDIERIGLSGEIVKVSDGFARNCLIPQGLGIEVTSDNETFYAKRAREVKNRKEVIESKTSILAEKISSLKLKLKRKIHDDGKLYGAVNAGEIVDLLGVHGISIAKNQVLFNKSIKSKGVYDVTIKLTSRLKPQVKITVVSE